MDPRTAVSIAEMSYRSVSARSSVTTMKLMASFGTKFGPRSGGAADEFRHRHRPATSSGNVILLDGISDTDIPCQHDHPN
jgi:hypothetical protein